MPKRRRQAVADSLTSETANHGSAPHSHAIVHQVQLAFAHSTQTVFYIMAAVLAATFLVALRWLPRGRVAADAVFHAEAAPSAAPGAEA